MSSLVSIRREVQKIKQKMKPDKPKDIWLEWCMEVVTKENVNTSKNMDGRNILMT